MMNSYQSCQHAVATEHLAAAHASAKCQQPLCSYTQQLPVTQYSSCRQQSIVIEMFAAESVSHWCLATLVSHTATPKIAVPCMDC